MGTLYHTERYSRRCSHLINIENYPRHCWTYETKYKRAKEKQKLERVLIRVWEYPEEKKSLLKKLFFSEIYFPQQDSLLKLKLYVHSICNLCPSKSRRKGSIWEPSRGYFGVYISVNWVNTFNGWKILDWSEKEGNRKPKFSCSSTVILGSAGHLSTSLFFLLLICTPKRNLTRLNAHFILLLNNGQLLYF